jgi:hypothetical protein
MVTKIVDQVMEDTLIKKIALQVAEMLRSGGVGKDSQEHACSSCSKHGFEIKKDLENGLYPDLPTYREIPMEKKLVQKLKTQPSAPLKVDSDNSLNIVVPTLESGRDYIRDGLTFVKTRVAKVDPKKETALAQETDVKPALSKSAKRRLRIQRKKQASNSPAVPLNSHRSSSEERNCKVASSLPQKNTPAVPLNFLAPVKSGAPTTGGMNTLSHSHSNLKRSGKATSLSQEQVGRKKLQGGKQLAATSLASQNMPGPQGEQRQKSAALSSNATNIL